jgi:sugar phosphate isomerase/epimerase/L-amino acid N-acyltransferase YncA
MKIGLKLFSTNDFYINEALKLYKEKVYDYIELYVVPNSFEDFISLWKSLDIPFIIHAPHFRHGVNLAKKEQFEQNLLFSKEAQKYADTLNSKYIIFHPGIAGDLEESVRQINLIKDERILIENKPYSTVLNDGNICNGNSPEEIKYLLENTNASFCLDIGHCFCSANAQNIEPFQYLKEFFNLYPKMFHLTDNEFKSPVDKHLHFGDGDFNVEKILNLLHENAQITLETIKNSKENLDDFIKDVTQIKNYNFDILKASESDLTDVFNLSNDEQVRTNSFNSNKIKIEEHKSWFNKKINDPACLFFLMRNKQKNELIAQIRFDENEIKNEYTVNISIDPKYRGKGYASKFLKITSCNLPEQFGVKKIIANIKPANKASLYSFQNSGYKITEETSEKICLEYVQK